MKGIGRNLTSYGDADFSLFLRRAFLTSAGYDEDDLERPTVGIADTTSDLTTCHRSMPELVESVKRGVLEAGGLPFRFPTMSLGEILMSPTTMLFRNLMAMETEELVRSQPLDAVVYLGGCDKTLPAQLMASVSTDVPAVIVPVGPMRTGQWEGRRLGACTDCRGAWAEYRAGEIDDEELRGIEGSLCPTAGTCMVMGTASTMSCLLEAMGLAPAGGGTAPAVTAERLRIGVEAGRRAVALIRAGGPTTRDVVGPSTIRNAARVLAALGGSTNAVIHLLAVARRAGVPITLAELDAIWREVPVLVDCKPVGTGYLEDFHGAGGMRRLLAVMRPFLELDAPTVFGATLGATIGPEAGPAEWSKVIREPEDPVAPPGGIAALHGSLAPDGAVLKASAASESLLRHTGPAVVFDGPEDLAARIDDPSLNVTPDHVLVLRNAGPVAAGMPEAGSIPIPRHLAAVGVRDMVRVSDARMSGTAYGTVVLHCAPEAGVGGPLAFVHDGDPVSLDVPERRLDLLVDPDELDARRRSWQPSTPPQRGWRHLYAKHVLQANEGADLDFL